MKTFVKHVYDIDLVNIYKLLDNKISNDTSEKGAAKKKDFLERLSFSVKQIFQSNKENYNLKEEDYESLPSYVITPNNNFDNYIYWLGLFLLSNPSYKTNLILEYHFSRWVNKMKFLNCVEFYILDSISNNDFIEDELVVKTLSEWILFKRLNNGYPSSNTDTSENETSDKTKTNKKTKSNENLILINKSYYETKDVNSPEMGDESISSTEKTISASIVFADKVGEVLLSVLSERLFDKSDYKNLEELLLNGKSNGLIGLSITKLDLIGLFKDLINTEAFIYIRNKRKVAKWICSNFKTDNIPNNVKGEFNLQTTINRLSDKTYFYNKDFVSDVIDKINKSRAGTKD
jgi:hypothetical protein